jgi:hypothetical protein
MMPTLAETARRLPTAWSVRTASLWSPDDPARGQCSVTALVIQDLYGGTLLKTRVGHAWHFYNRIDGRRHDLTAGQFAEPIAYDDIGATREEALADTSPEQVRALHEALAEAPRPAA